MKIDEIYTLGASGYIGDESLHDPAFRSMKFFPPVELGDDYVLLYDSTGDGPYITVVICDRRARNLEELPASHTLSRSYELRRRQLRTLEHGYVIATLKLSRMFYFLRESGSFSYTVDAVTVDKAYRGAGLARHLYGFVLKDLNITLVAGDSQTPDGQRMWKMLFSTPGIDVTGWVSIPEESFTMTSNRKIQALLDRLLGKIGAQYIGQSGHNDKVFEFEVTNPESGKRLVAAVKSSLTQLYDESGLDDIVTGLMAKSITSA